jgi:hypothetical protein
MNEKKAIFDKLKNEQTEMVRANFYLPKELYDEFKTECEKASVPMSGVLT